MKIETIEPDFKPITITLETKDEFLQFHAFLEEPCRESTLIKGIRIGVRKLVDAM